MTERNNPAELGANTSTSKPCDQCPMHLWAVLHDPANREAERHIRADEARRWRRKAERDEARIEVLELEVRRLRAKKSA